MTAHDATTFALLVNLEALSNQVFTEFMGQQEVFWPNFVEFDTTGKQQEKRSEMGGFGYAVQKNPGATVTYSVMADGKAKTITPLTFMLGARHHKELVRDALRTGTFDFAARSAEALAGAILARQELRTANLYNNSTSSSGRYGIPGYDGTTEALASNSHSAAEGGTQDNLMAVAVSEDSVQDMIAMFRTQKDMQGVPRPAIPVFCWASVAKDAVRLEEILQPLLLQRPVIATADTIDGTTSTSDLVPVSSNVIARKYNIQVMHNPFFTGTHWGMRGRNHGFLYLQNWGFESDSMSDFDTTDFKQTVSIRFETATWKFRDTVVSTGY